MSFLEPSHSRQTSLRREIYERAPVQYVAAAPAGPPHQDLLDTFRRIWRHRVMVLAVTAAFGVVALVVLSRLPSLYVGESQVEVGVP
ncbi:MAG TPA: hypothetical protein VNG52_06835, partial [Stellaceae bacterium]|nr:hypothetical protein [Stellaceae bacterium]